MNGEKTTRMKKFRITVFSHLRYGQTGFTMVEVAVVVVILGLLLAVGSLSYAGIRKSMIMSGAKKQVEEVIQRAKTAARQENVSYRLVFYSQNEAVPNSYEFFCNTKYEQGTFPNKIEAWVMEPVDKSVTGENKVTKVIDGKTHTYVKLSNNVIIENTVVITISPVGTTYSVTPTTVQLKVADSTGSVSVDAVGRITVQ